MNEDLHLFCRQLCFDFLTWIAFPEDKDSITIVFSDEFADFMTIDGNTVYFRKQLSKSTSNDHYISEVIHEFSHFSSQGIGSKEIIERLRLLPGGSNKIALYDIEADMVTYKFLKENLGFDGHRVYSTQYYNAIEHPRPSLDELHKVSRFLGTISSIEASFYNDTDVIIYPTMFKFNIGELLILERRKSELFNKHVSVTIDEQLFNAGRSLYLEGKDYDAKKYIDKARQLAQIILNIFIKQKTLTPEIIL